MKRIVFCGWWLLCLTGLLPFSRAELDVTISEPKSTGSKVIVKLTMKNNFTNAVESARAVVFMIDAKGKVVGQRTEWVIGGTKEKPGLAANATAVFNMVIAADKPIERAQVTFTRIILEGGRLAEKGFVLTN